MGSSERVWLRDDRGIRTTTVVPPAAWRGERGCIVGPFTSVQAARTFLLLRQAGGGANVFAAGSAFFIKMPE